MCNSLQLLGINGCCLPAKPPPSRGFSYRPYKDSWFADRFLYCFRNTSWPASPPNLCPDLCGRSENRTNLTFWLSWHSARPEIGARQRSDLESKRPGECRGVAQPGSAPALGAGGRWFKSNRPDHLQLTQFTAFNCIPAWGICVSFNQFIKERQVPHHTAESRFHKKSTGR